MTITYASQPPARITPNLTPREVEVLRAWLTSESKEEAARALFVATTTVITHITRVRAKYARVGRSTGCKARLLAAALRDGFIHLDDFDLHSAARTTPRSAPRRRS